MTEDEARDWVCNRFGSDAARKLEQIGNIVAAESERQNLVARSTLRQMWVRHLTDSAQLVPLALDPGHWVDIGTGAGFPGLVVATLVAGDVTLVEPRGKRARFLVDVADTLNLRTKVVQARVEVVAPSTNATTISARAVASASDLLSMTSHLRGSATQYIMPRGHSGHAELEQLQRAWSGVFHVEHSITDPASVILTATGVTPRCSVSP